MRCDFVPSLDVYLADWSQRRFAYGAVDCVRFVAGWIAILKGSDPLIGWPAYSTLEEANGVLSTRGMSSWTDAVSAVLPARQIMQARLGDIVALRATAALGICEGARCIFLAPDIGLVRRPLTACDKAWSLD